MNEENTASAPVAEAKSGSKLTLILIILIVLSAIGLVYLYTKYNELSQDPTQANREQIERVVEKANKLIDLPADELPTLATITDLEQLAEQPFFANAQVGDQVLLYTTAGKAYLYSPSRNIIVEVASLNLGE